MSSPVGHILSLIVEDPKYDGRMMLKSSDLFPDLHPRIVDISLILHWIEFAGETRIMPDEHSHFVGQIIKFIGEIHSSAPDAQHVIVGLLS